MRAVRCGRLAAAMLLIAGCGGENAPATLVGDAFLAQNIDQQVNLAGLPVHLLRPVEELDSLLAPLCPPRGPGDAPPPREAWDRGWAARAHLLAPLRLRTAVTDSLARFAIDSVTPGEYLLAADTTLSGKRWTWLVRVDLDEGDSLRVNLTNDNPDENPLRCGPRGD